MNIIIFIIMLLVLVIVHEFGHFFTAKKFGIRVDEFGFGFPPKIFGKKFGETEYTFNLLPIGGFVKIFGENPDEESISGPDSARSFVNKPAWQQAIVLFAGVFANFLLAWLLFSVGFMSGFPASVGAGVKNYPVRDVSTVIVSVSPNSPAEAAGLKSGDKIFSIKSGNTSPSSINPETVKALITNSKGRDVEIAYTEGDSKEVSYVKLTPTQNGGEASPTIGIAMDQIGITKLPFFTALYEGMRLNISMTKSTFMGLYGLIGAALGGHGSFNGLSGPVGMVGIVGDAYSLGFIYLLSFAALISINLAIINLLPFPALDGGRLFFLLIEKIKGSRINPNFANTANMIGFGVLILLMVVITYHDVAKLL